MFFSDDDPTRAGDRPLHPSLCVGDRAPCVPSREAPRHGVERGLRGHGREGSGGALRTTSPPSTGNGQGASPSHRALTARTMSRMSSRRGNANRAYTPRKPCETRPSRRSALRSVASRWCASSLSRHSLSTRQIISTPAYWLGDLRFLSHTWRAPHGRVRHQAHATLRKADRLLGLVSQGCEVVWLRFAFPLLELILDIVRAVSARWRR